MLELKNINKYYNAGTVNEMCLFQDFNLSIDDHEFVSVVGSNGSGKTSMLNIICGSIPVDSGTISINAQGHYCIDKAFFQNAQDQLQDRIDRLGFVIFSQRLLFVHTGREDLRRR